MSRAVELNIRRVTRSATLLVGALADAIKQGCFVARYPARGLLHAEPAPTPKHLAKAIEHGARFLTRQQHADGSLRGFCLYPGASSTWLTAHVCFVVEGVPLLDGLAARAARYLARHGANDGGWGYNRRVAVDCDSTAQALMALQRFALPFPDFLLDQLAAAQAAGGGYPTYAPHRADTPRDGWQAVHSEVSLMVWECLRRAGGFDTRVARCAAWLATVGEGGVLPAYWWSDNAYALWLQARTGTLSAAARPAVEALLASGLGCPQLAMVLSAAMTFAATGVDCAHAARRLIATQLADGSWPCAPCLRVTSPGTHIAASQAAGKIVADRRRVFATAHAVAALQSYSTRGAERGV